MLEPKAVRRVEVITGNGSAAAVSGDGRLPRGVVSAVARRHGLTPSQLWRRQVEELTSAKTSVACCCGQLSRRVWPEAKP